MVQIILCHVRLTGDISECLGPKPASDSSRPSNRATAWQTTALRMTRSHGLRISGEHRPLACSCRHLAGNILVRGDH